MYHPSIFNLLLSFVSIIFSGGRHESSLSISFVLNVFSIISQDEVDSPNTVFSAQQSPQDVSIATDSPRSQPHSHNSQLDLSKARFSQGSNGVEDEYRDSFDVNSRPVSELSSSVSNSRLKDFGSRPVSNVTGSRPESEQLSSRPDSQSTFSRPSKRPSSSIIEALQIENELFSYGLDPGPRISDGSRDSPDLDLDDQALGNVSDDSIADIDFDPLYQEVDQNHESVYEPKRNGPPQIRIERKIFQERMDSFVSSSNDSEDMLERIHRPVYAIMDKPTMPVEPMRSTSFEPQARSSGFIPLDEETISPDHSSPITLTPISPQSPRTPLSPRSMRSPISPIMPHLPDLVSSPLLYQKLQTSSQSSSSTNTVSAIATLPRRPPTKPPPVHFDFEDSVISRLDSSGRPEGQVVTAEVHSAPATVSRQGSRNKPTMPKPTRARLHTWVSFGFKLLRKKFWAYYCMFFK